MRSVDDRNVVTRRIALYAAVTMYRTDAMEITSDTVINQQ
jgi:hypothetical protein